MKKIFFAAISLMMMLVTISCSNDEIVVEKVGRRYNLACVVNTQGIYDKFDLANDVRDTYLRDGSRSIGVHTYLYDNNGDLVKSDLKVLSTYNAATVNYENLVEGSYTVIVVETLVNPDVNNTSEDWSFEGVDKLSTVKVKTNGTLGWASIIGVTSKTFNLSNNTELSLDPEALGARINYYCYNVGNASYIVDGSSKRIQVMGLATTDILNYYHLNPQLSLNDRYSEDLTATGYTNVRASMSTERFDAGYYTYFYIVEREVTWRFCWQFDGNKSWSNYKKTNITSTIENGKTYYAGFYYLGDDYYPSTYFGDQNGLRSWKTECDALSSSTQSTLYSAPYTNWTVGTVAAVKSFMNGFTLMQDVKLNDSSNKYEMLYYDSDGNIYEYDFTSSTKGLTDSYVLLNKEKFTLSTVRNIVANQGYTFNSQNGNNYYYTSATTYVTVYQAESGAILVNYYDPKAYGAAPKHEIPVLKETMALKMKCDNRINKMGATVKLEESMSFNNSFKNTIKKSIFE